MKPDGAPRTCFKCGKTYDATPLNFPTTDRTRTKLRTECRNCMAQSSRESYTRHRAERCKTKRALYAAKQKLDQPARELRYTEDGAKICYRCGTAYPDPAASFSPDRHHSDKLASNCKACRAEIARNLRRGIRDNEVEAKNGVVRRMKRKLREARLLLVKQES